MIFFPNSKINLGLKVLGKRTDGYHDLETVFYPLPLRDVLEIVPAAKIQFTAAGLPVPGSSEQNLCLRAYSMLKKDFPDLPAVHIYLFKHIPMGAGLGGGSSDGAAMLQLLNDYYRLQLSQEKLLDYAAALGSDCPFFILNKPCLGKGRGELLKPVGVDLSAYSFAIVHPGIHISTVWAFSQLVPGRNDKPLEEILSQPIDTWTADLLNDFEAPIVNQYPELQRIKDELRNQGALYASLTGSGSAFFGIYEKGKLPNLSFGPDYSIFLLT
ncbi:4-(cytidine 5'-diphospho)-2-C-methyl-D-erythritol kinase [Flavitalea flava]